jgi:hypothetical protein
MELRFARAARTTKDFDLGLEGNRVERIGRLADVLQLEFDAFTFRLKPKIHEMELPTRCASKSRCNTKRGPGRQLRSISVRAERGKWTWWNRRLQALLRWAYRWRRMYVAWASTSRFGRKARPLH